jgi:hypothetical protein
MLHRLIAFVTCLGAAFVFACGRGDAPPPASGPPQVREVAPRTVSNDREALILLKGEGFRPGVRVAVGPNLVGREVGGRVAWLNERIVAVTFASGLPPGDYDVGVTNLDGRWSKLDAALRIRAAAPTPPSAPPPATTAPAQPATTATVTATPTPARSATPEPVATATPTPAPTPPVPTAAPTQTRGITPPPNPTVVPFTPGPITRTPPRGPTQGAQPGRNPPQESRRPSR